MSHVSGDEEIASGQSCGRHVELSRDVISTLSNSIGNYFTFPFISSVSERHGHSWGDLGLVREKRKAGSLRRQTLQVP